MLYLNENHASRYVLLNTEIRSEPNKNINENTSSIIYRNCNLLSKHFKSKKVREPTGSYKLK